MHCNNWDSGCEDVECTCECKACVTEILKDGEEPTSG